MRKIILVAGLLAVISSQTLAENKPTELLFEQSDVVPAQIPVTATFALNIYRQQDKRDFFLSPIELAEEKHLDLNSDGQIDSVSFWNQQCLSDPNFFCVACSQGEGKYFVGVYGCSRGSFSTNVVDINNDGVYEIKTHDLVPGNFFSNSYAAVSDIWKWNGKKYVLASSEFPSFYEATLTRTEKGFNEMMRKIKNDELPPELLRNFTSKNEALNAYRSDHKRYQAVVLLKMGRVKEAWDKISSFFCPETSKFEQSDALSVARRIGGASEEYALKVLSEIGKDKIKEQAKKRLELLKKEKSTPLKPR